MMRVRPPGRASRRLIRALSRYEAPLVNTVIAGEAYPPWREARGANVLDVDGNRYIDLSAGFGATILGHRDTAIVTAVQRQSRILIHALGDVASHPGRIELAQRLARLAPVLHERSDPRQVYFAVSGADAVEVAIKTALLARRKKSVIAFDPAYHGTSFGALAATSRASFRTPFAAQLNPHVYRLPYACDPGDLKRLCTHADDIAALIVEPIAGREGVYLPPPGWLAEVATICRCAGVLLIADEILTGFGRTGRLFAVQHEGVKPDLLCCGKALGGGLPIAAVVARKSIFASWDRDGEALHTATFLAHPLSVAAALAVLEALPARRLVRRAKSLGRRLEGRFQPWLEKFSSLVDVRGRGLLWGLELKSPRCAHQAVSMLLERGIIVVGGGTHGSTLELTPALTVSERQLDAASDVLESVLCELS